MTTTFRATFRALWQRGRLVRWSLRILFALVVVAFFGDVIANNKPLYCVQNGETSWPAVREWGKKLTFQPLDGELRQNDWLRRDYDRVIWPLIPYAAARPDVTNRMKAPFSKQQVKSTHFRHWLGTNTVGQDVLAGLVAGTRVALLVGLLAMGIACLIGLLLGGLAGFYGDHGMKISRGECLAWGVSGSASLFYLFSLGGRMGGVAVLIALVLGYGLGRLLERLPGLSSEVAIPWDLLVMRLIEIVSSLPGLLILLVVIAILPHPNIYWMMFLIGLFSWTGIARFVRAELLRIREMAYVEAARGLGMAEWKILLRHALPNALGPVFVTLAFGIAGAILLEAVLSFLGIGLPLDQITWGRMLNDAIGNARAWWLAVFPGLAIFFTVTIFNLLGEGLSDVLDPRRREI